MTASYRTDSISYGKKKSSHLTISYWKKNHPIHPHYLIHHLIHSLTITIVCIVVECLPGSGNRLWQEKKKPPILKFLEKRKCEPFTWSMCTSIWVARLWEDLPRRSWSLLRQVSSTLPAMQSEFANCLLLLFSLPQVCSRSTMQTPCTCAHARGAAETWRGRAGIWRGGAAETWRGGATETWRRRGVIQGGAAETWGGLHHHTGASVYEALVSPSLLQYIDAVCWRSP